MGISLAFCMTFLKSLFLVEGVSEVGEGETIDFVAVKIGFLPSFAVSGWAIGTCSVS